MEKLSEDEQNLLRMIFDWWFNHDTWPREDMFGRSNSELVSPDRFDATLDSLKNRKLVEMESGTRRLWLKLSVLGCFPEASRILRHVLGFFEIAKQDLSKEPDKPATRNYSVRELCSRLHIDVNTCRRVVQALGADAIGTNANERWFNDTGFLKTTEEIFAMNIFWTPLPYRKLVVAKGPWEYLKENYGLGDLKYKLRTFNHPDKIPIVLAVSAEKNEVFLDGVIANVPKGRHIEFLEQLIKAQGKTLEYKIKGTSWAASSNESVRGWIANIRDALDGAAQCAELDEFKSEDHIVPERSVGYKFISEGSRWVLIQPYW